MKYTLLFLIVTFTVFTAKANNQEEIDEFCRSNENYDQCLRDYIGLPKLEVVPKVNEKKPVAINVKPYIGDN